jgi:mannose-6-phosphate isomerase-like protein (cupin superfamily)
MHVAPPDLRALRQGDLVIRFALLGPVAFVLAEIPESGSSGTSIERPSQLPHWALVIDGDVTFESEAGSLRVPAGHALYVPGGSPEHHFHATGRARIAGFQPIDPSVDYTDASRALPGFEVVPPGTAGGAAPIIAPATSGEMPAAGAIVARSWSMPPYAMTTARFGVASGYTSDWCDAPHWGLVTNGQLTIEYEHDVEIVTAGDVYYCPAGAPAHRLQAADPATVVDITPIEAITGVGRIAQWRRAAFAQTSTPEGSPIAVVPIG